MTDTPMRPAEEREWFMNGDNERATVISERELAALIERERAAAQTVLRSEQHPDCVTVLRSAWEALGAAFEEARAERDRLRAAARDQIAAALMLACPCCEATWREPHLLDCTYAFDCPDHNAERNRMIRVLEDATCPQP